MPHLKPHALLMSAIAFMGVSISVHAQIVVSANDGRMALVDGKLTTRADAAPGTVTILQVQRGSAHVIGELEVPTSVLGPPFSIAVTPDERLALVSAPLYMEPGSANDSPDDSISVVDLEAHPPRVISTIAAGIGVGFKPYGIAIASDASIAVVANVSLGRGDEDTLSVVDLKRTPIRVVDTVSVGQTPEGIALSPDGKWCAIALLNGSNKPPDSPFFNPAGKLVLLRVEGTALTRVSSQPLAPWPQGAVFAADSRTLLVGNMTERNIQVFHVGRNGSLTENAKRIPLKGGNAALRAAEPVRPERSVTH